MSTSLPVNRIKTIMKSSPEVEMISNDSVVLIAKATELFIRFLSVEALSTSKDGKKLDYDHVANVVQTDDRLDFLREMVPRKITVREFKEILKKKKKQMGNLNNTNTGDQGGSGSSTSETEEDSDCSSLSENASS